MPRRPTSSAGGESRPYTSGGFRPSTAHDPNANGFDRDPQYTYSLEEDEEEDEESDAEDLFAFLPPSTADQQQQYQEHTDYQQHAASPKHEPDYDSLFAAHVPMHQVMPITPPPPTFDPYARYPADSAAGPSGLQSSYLRQAVDSPPSTASNPISDDAYRMRRMNNTQSTNPDTQASRASGVSSREMHIALPTEKSMSIQEGYSPRPHGKHRSSTLAETFSGMSMMDNDSEGGSVK